jgi:hypothetical protein
MADKESNQVSRQLTYKQIKKECECAGKHLATNIEKEDYLKCRVTYKIKLYGRLGNTYRWLYWITSLTALISAAAVPVLIRAGNYELLAIILSLVVTVLVGVEKLFHFREHWRNYDSIESYLRQEQLLYQTRAGFYKAGKNKDKDEDKIKADKEAFELFVRRIEDGIKHERAETIDMRTTEAPR